MAVAHRTIATGYASPGLIRLVIVDGQQLIGQALAALLGAQDDLEVLASVDFDDVQRVTRMDPHPDIAIVDFSADAPAAARAAEELRRVGCDAPVIILADRTVSYQVVQAAIQAEASAIVSGSESANTLLRVIHRASTGTSLLEPSMLRSFLGDRRARDASRERVSRREMDVLALLSKGKPARQIASALGIRYPTVRTHVRNLAGKLGAHSKLEIVTRAYELDLIPAPHRVPSKTTQKGI